MEEELEGSCQIRFERICIMRLTCSFDTAAAVDDTVCGAGEGAACPSGRILDLTRDRTVRATGRRRTQGGALG